MLVVELVRLRRALAGEIPAFDPIRPGRRGLGDTETGARVTVPTLAVTNGCKSRWGAARKGRTPAWHVGC